MDEHDFTEMMAEQLAALRERPALLEKVRRECPDQHWDIWQKEIRRSWPSLNLQATASVMSFGKARIRIGRLNSMSVDTNY